MGRTDPMRRRFNCKARTLNSVISRGTTEISPLYSLHTGEPIAGFPLTTDHLLTLEPSELRRILAELRMVGQGSHEQMQQQLLAECGLAMKWK